jgi:O-antigen ligase
MFAVFVGTLGLASRWSGPTIREFIVVAGFVQISFSLFVELSTGQLALSDSAYRFSGILHPNREGQLSAVLALTALSIVRSDTRWRRIALFIALYATAILILTKSLTSLVGFVTAAATFVFLTSPRRGRKSAIYLGAITVLSFALLIPRVSALLFPIASAVGREPENIATFTGRFPLWRECLGYVGESPIFGHGYEAFWTTDREQDISWAVGWEMGSAHSTYLDLLLTLGVVGLLLHTGVLLSALRRASILYRRTRIRDHALTISVLIAFLIFGLLETTTILYPSSTTFFVLMLILFTVMQPITGGREHDERRHGQNVPTD